MVHNGMLFGERRRKERKNCSRLIEVDDYRSRYKGHLRNLTADGAFFEPASQMKVYIGQELSITIPYGLKRADLTIKAKVAWIDNNQGIGVFFLNADVLQTLKH